MNHPPGQDFFDRFADVQAQEHELLKARRARRGIDADGPTAGLALSGGGIRAAAFAMGVMRALHSLGRFKSLDYLSTVSGGGFSGTFVSWLLRNGNPATETAEGPVPEAALQFLRSHANYLDPGGGAGSTGRNSAPTAVGLFGATLGRMFLSVGIYAALLIGLFTLLHIGDAIVDLQKPVLDRLTRTAAWMTFVDSLNFASVAALVVLVAGVVRQIGALLARALRHLWRAAVPPVAEPAAVDVWTGLLWSILAIVCAALSLLALATIPSGLPGPLSAALAALVLGAASLASFRQCRNAWRAPAAARDLRWPWLLLPVLAALLTVAALTGLQVLFLFVSGASWQGIPARLSTWQSLLAGVVAASWLVWLVPRGLGKLYRTARALAQPGAPEQAYLRSLGFLRRSGGTLMWAAGWLVLASVSWTSGMLKTAIDSPNAHLSVLTAAGLLVSVWVAFRVAVSNPVRAARHPAFRLRPWMIQAICAAVLYGLLLLTHGLTETILNSRTPGAAIWVPMLGLLLGLLAAINFTGPGRIYRDRLGEAFLPDAEAMSRNRWYPALTASRFWLSELRSADATGPYHLLNASIATNGSRDARLRGRGSDSFVLSPLYCGSAATGWADSEHWLEGRLTLRDALGISAAALEPGAAFDGHGVTRSSLVSATLALLDLQLGYWADNPNPLWRRRAARIYPNLITPGLHYGVLAAGPSETSGWVQLSDGSNFDNLGLYELLRRRLDLVIVADSSTDPDYGFAALGIALERARQDFGVAVRFESGAFPGANEGDPHEDACIRRGFAIGSIQYPDQHVGRLLYIKPTLIEDLDISVRSFATVQPNFPQESTLNQNFDEEHFVAYERLGYQIGLSALDALDAPTPASYSAG